MCERNGGSGTYAELHVARADTVVGKPANLSYVETAAVPLAGATAVSVIRRRLRVQPGERVLVHGAGGGVGTFASSSFGPQRGSVSPLRALGTTSCCCVSALPPRWTIRSRTPRSWREKRPAETSTPSPISSAARPLRAVFHFCARAGVPQRSPSWPVISNSRSTRTSRCTAYCSSERPHAVGEELNTEIEAGRLQPVVMATYPLEEVAEAHRRLEAGHVQGKIVLVIDRVGAAVQAEAPARNGTSPRPARNTSQGAHGFAPNESPTKSRRLQRSSETYETGRQERAAQEYC